MSSENEKEPPTGFVRIQNPETNRATKESSAEQDSEEEIFVPIQTTEQADHIRHPPRPFPENMESSQEIPLVSIPEESPPEESKDESHTEIYVRAAPEMQNIPKPRAQPRQIPTREDRKIDSRLKSYTTIFFFLFLFAVLIVGCGVIYYTLVFSLET